MAGGLEVADVFRRHGPAFRATRSEHLDRDQRRVMGAIEACRIRNSPHRRRTRAAPMLTALRLPSFHRHWSALADRADDEVWPAARFLALPMPRRRRADLRRGRPRRRQLQRATIAPIRRRGGGGRASGTRRIVRFSVSWTQVPLKLGAFGVGCVVHSFRDLANDDRRQPA